MMKRLHPISGTVALLLICSFWISTTLSELFGSAATITTVKTLIPWGLLLLVPAMATVGLTGTTIGQRRHGPLVEAKRKRMPIIAANGVLVLIPAALFLAMKARAGAFDGAFYAVQGIELIAGAVNIWLLSRNMRDGMRLSGKRELPSAG